MEQLAEMLGTIVTAIGALGVAAYALVDASKIGRSGGVSNAGFGCIRACIGEFFPGVERASRAESDAARVAAGNRLLDILHGNWINGMPLADQKAIAKSLIKLRLDKDRAVQFAKATGVDATALAATADSMNSGKELSPEQNNVLGRFDLALMALLDEGYQRADQKYRNSARVLASGVAVILAVACGWSLSEQDLRPFLESGDLWRSVLAGLLATPLAPIAKDLASALSAGVKVAQAIKR